MQLDNMDKIVITPGKTPIKDIVLPPHTQLTIFFDFSHISPEQPCIYRLYLEAYAQLTSYFYITHACPHLTIELHLRGIHAAAQLRGAYMLKQQESISIVTRQHHYAP